MAPPAPVFGLVYGLLVAESQVVGPLAGWAASWIVFGGASQLAAVLVLEAGGSALFAIVTILVVNARHAMYSAALQPRFRELPRWFRLVSPYLLTDQAFATADERPATDPPAYLMSFFLGGATFWFLLWNVSVAVGVVAGNAIPESWSFDFAVPLLFLALLVNVLRDRPAMLAAVTSGLVAVAGRNLEPAGLGLLAGAASGILVASLTEWAGERRAERTDGQP